MTMTPPILILTQIMNLRKNGIEFKSFTNVWALNLHQFHDLRSMIIVKKTTFKGHHIQLQIQEAFVETTEAEEVSEAVGVLQEDVEIGRIFVEKTAEVSINIQTEIDHQAIPIACGNMTSSTSLKMKAFEI